MPRSKPFWAHDVVLKKEIQIANQRVGNGKPKFSKQNKPANNHTKRMKVYERDGNKCLRCGRKENLTLDHVIPSCLGGSSAISNLQTLCELCNQLKGKKIIDYRIRPLATAAVVVDPETVWQ